MFRLDEDFTEEDLSEITAELDINYILKPNDILLLSVFTNGGERLVDPNFELSTGQIGQQQQQMRDIFQYTIQADSIVTFPMVGDMNLVGLTLYEAELQVAKAFDTFYGGSFVKLRIPNRRVFVLGAPGGSVIPLSNENTTLVEVLALSGGIAFGARAQNIRLIRGEKVFWVDLSTVSGMKKSNLTVEPGDIIYIEPWRRPWVESLRDVTPTLSIVSSVLALIIVIQSL